MGTPLISCRCHHPSSRRIVKGDLDRAFDVKSLVYYLAMETPGHSATGTSRGEPVMRGPEPDFRERDEYT